DGGFRLRLDDPVFAPDAAPMEHALDRPAGGFGVLDDGAEEAELLAGILGARQGADLVGEGGVPSRRLQQVADDPGIEQLDEVAGGASHAGATALRAVGEEDAAGGENVDFLRVVLVVVNFLWL